MSVLLFLIPITLILGLLGLCAFLWALKTKQYDDLQGAASRILFEDVDEENDKKRSENSAEENNKKNEDNKKI